MLHGGRCSLQVTDSAFALIFQDTRLTHEQRSIFCSVAYLHPESLTDLVNKSKIGYRKVRTTCRELAVHGWLRFVHRANILRPVCWVPSEYQEYLINELEQDYALSPFGGEFLFGRVLGYLVDVPKFIHNARPTFLRHPKTKEPLELDYFAPNVLGGEFNGQQHYCETRKYSKQVVAETQARDLIKEALCTRAGLPLIVANTESLSILSVMNMLPPNTPRHVLDLSDPYPKKLDELCAMYRRKVARTSS